VQHSNKLKGQLESGKIVSALPLTITLTNMPYAHFTPDTRNQLAALLRAKVKKKNIARQLRKHRTTVWRERQRGKGANDRYYVRKANQLAKERRIKANSRFRKIENNKYLKRYIVKKLRKYWSPEQIAGRWNEQHKKKRIAKDTVYKFIYEKRKDLVRYLRCQKGKYRRRYGTRIREKQREELKKKRIDQRPQEAELRLKIGHWEGDTIWGKDRQQILTHLERKSGLILADKLEAVTAKETREKTKARFRNIPKDKKITVTYDNGLTFSEYELIERETGLAVYFAYPYHSWERGSNENANGLLRQFFPKKTNFATITQKDIEKAVRLLNNRPRKRLSYLTPYEVFKEKTKCCTLE